jgi:hypothetical protein
MARLRARLDFEVHLALEQRGHANGAAQRRLVDANLRLPDTHHIHTHADTLSVVAAAGCIPESAPHRGSNHVPSTFTRRGRRYRAEGR